MINLVNLRKIRYFVRDYWPTLLTLLSLGIVILLIMASYKTYKESQNDLDVLSEEVKLLKNRSDTLQYNKTLTEDQIVVYNKILTTLIPETEDYFSIIYALETISQNTGFSIVSYTINLSNISREKLSINIEGRGNPDDFKRFLDAYKFSGGRLITSERIEFSGVNFTNTRVSLNFYSKKFTFNESVVPQLTKGDIAKLEEIKKKIKISFKDESTPTEEEYEVKDNPF